VHQRLIGLFKGDDRSGFRLGFRIFNHNGGRLRDQRFTQAVEDIVARVLVQIYKPQKLMTGFRQPGTGSFHPGTERL
jgi:hypothetical protein